MDLTVNIGRLKLKNPVMTASGTFGYGEEYSEFVDLNKLGAIVVKGLSLKPMEGNPAPRIYETPCGMLNAIGLQNVGVKEFLKTKLPYIRKFDTKLIVNIFGNTLQEYVKLSRILDDAGVDGIELNVSCPNIKKGGIFFGTDKKMLQKLVAKVRASVSNAVLITKLSPNVSYIQEFAKIAEECGSEAVSLINTIPGMAIDIKTRRPRIANITGGLSGPAIKPIAVRMVYETFKAVKIPVIGMGGIMNSGDAIEFMIAGAASVAIGTANFVNPSATIDIIKGIESFMAENSIRDVKELRGAIKI
ncbi:MAG: dihydroorotate dehydrogenase [Nitrospirae bacterium CG_4_10_14_3_um_filter_44_29]|nr:dihydroorotate dehydrogenase [Nitrospirota bacterium]OIO28672.1 MAG: dihydroorotate dehydrogenase B catalytic subunit [Nitrospirae bacterium CG1_02_44_142]PIX87567.1 MAG: dihydroorotate dehydrogenase [Nitrospirae bacterium CG_4_10_14_3_um_filter_44_29]